MHFLILQMHLHLESVFLGIFCYRQPIERVIMVLGQIFITDLTLSKRRLNEGIYKTLHNRAFAYYHKRTILP